MSDIEERIDKGAVRIRTIIEVLGAPKEHVEETLKLVMETIKQREPKIHIIDAKVFEAEPHEELWSSFVEADLLMKDIAAVTDFCFEFMPAEVEIVEPQELKIRGADYSNFVNDVIGKIHKIDMLVKNISAENQLLKKDITNIFKIHLFSVVKDDDRTAGEIAADFSTTGENIAPMLDRLVSEGFLRKEADKYGLIRKA